MRRLQTLAVGAVAALPSTAFANDSGASFHSNYTSMSNGYGVRTATGAFVDLYGDRAGAHGDFVTIGGRNSGTYGAVGASYQVSDLLRPRLMIGTSVDSDGVLPKLLVAASTKFTPAPGVIITPSVTYRDYGKRKNGGERHYTQASLSTARYFTMPIDHSGYWAFQAQGDIAIDTVEKHPWSFGAGLQTVRKNGLRFGALGSVGYMAWDSETNAKDVQSRAWNVGVSGGYKLAIGPEIFVRASRAHNDYYNADGITVGLHLTL